MSMAERLCDTLIAIGERENVPDDMNGCSAEETREIIENVGSSSHRDGCRAVATARVLVAEMEKKEA